MGPELAEAIKTVLTVIDIGIQLLEDADLDDSGVTWDDFDAAIETLQEVVA